MSWDFPIVDPHVHQWDPRVTPRLVSPVVKLFGKSPKLLDRVLRLAFPAEAIGFVGKPDYVAAPYLPGTWRKDTGGAPLRGFVHIEAGWHARGDLAPVGETRWLEELCGHDLLAIVAHADLAGPHVAEVLRAHAEASRRVVGIRDMLAFDADPLVMRWASGASRSERHGFRSGYALLAEYGLSFDAWCYHPQLAELERLVSRHPETPVVLDHLGTPIGLGGPFGSYGGTASERDRIAKRWHESLSRLAEHSHVHAKLSGLAMPVVGFGWHERPDPPSVDEVVDRWGPHVEHALAAFGAERCMVASNFPMDKVSMPWTTLFEAFRQLTVGLGVASQRAVFHDTAARFYRLTHELTPARSASRP